MRQVITILEDNVSTAKHVDTIVSNGPTLTESALLDIAREEIAGFEGFEEMHDGRISDLVDRINRQWDDKITDVLAKALDDLLDKHCDPDDFDLLGFDTPGCIDSIPGIDVGELEAELKECRIKFQIEWKLRLRCGSFSTWSANTEKNDYFVILNELPEV